MHRVPLAQREYLVVRVVGKTPRPAETTTRHCQSGSEGRSFGADPDRRFLGLCYGVQTRSLASCLRHQPRQEPRALTRMRGSVRGDWRKPVPYRDARELKATPAHRKLPMILPLVFYHGLGEWTVPRSLAEMIDAPDGVDDPLRGFAYTLRDLRRLDPWHLAQNPEVQAALVALWLVFEENVLPELLDLVTGGMVDGSEFESHIITYISEKFNIDAPTLEASLQRTKPQRWEILMGTAAESWLEQGRTEGWTEGKAEGWTEGKAEGWTEGKAEGEVLGIEKGKVIGIEKGKVIGIAEGKAETFLRQARLKFDAIPDARVAQVRAASLVQIDAWLDALILAEDLNDVFAKRTRH